jgi:hypothetical protein
MQPMTALSRHLGLSRRARLAWLLAVASVAPLAVAAAASPTPDPGSAVLVITTIATLVGVGALLVSRVPGNAIGWWLMLAGELVTAQAFAWAATEIGARAEPVAWTVIGWTALLSNLLEPLAITIVIIIVPLHFPDGRLPSHRWRWVLWLTVVAITAGTMVTLFGPGDDGPFGVGLLANPLAAPGLEPLLDPLGTVAAITIVPALVGAALSVVVRYRRAGRVERQQLKWLLAVASLAAIAFTASSVVGDVAASNALYLLGFVAVAALPVAIGVAILRYHLYDIDHIISRTVSWTLVSAALVAVFIVGVVVLQSILEGVTQAETLAVAASTLVAAVLFQPLRVRVQRAVDRRFDRTAVDAIRATTAFATRLRDEVDLETVTQDLVGTVDDVVRPASSRLWLRPVGGSPTAS